MKKTVRSALGVLVLSTMGALSGVVEATISPVAPFVGNHSETWESFPNYQTGPFYLANPTSIMGGFATIANDSMAVYQPSASAFFSLSENGDAKTSDGLKAMGINTSNATVVFTFASPVTSFGAYWGATQSGAIETDDITVNFSDGSSAVFNHDPVVPGSGVLVWRGWSSTVGITGISYTGDYVVIDGIQAITVPEPTSLLAVAGIAAVSTLRRRRGASD